MSGEPTKAHEQSQKDQAELNSQNQSVTDKKSASQKYCGLSNQGATCYMNSVLQAFFMTPDFRRAIFRWRYDQKVHGKSEYCIPYQLQKLFAKLQLRFSNHTSTKGLTRSFNWDKGNTFQQQDIQEFYTVFCDAIEQTTKNSEIDGFLHDIFGGTIVNFIKCSEHNFESTRLENFIHLTVTVKNPFEKIYNDSLEKSLQIYLKPEFLTGDNQYYLEEFNKKVDAVKGIKFIKLPKILGIILNRFSFNYFTMKREKLDDFVSFPFVLNMNKYIEGYEGIKDKVQEVSEQYFEGKPKSYKEIKKQGSLENLPRIKSGVSLEKYVGIRSENIESNKNANLKPMSIQDEIKQPKRDKDVDVIVDSEETNEIDIETESNPAESESLKDSNAHPSNTEEAKKGANSSKAEEEKENKSGVEKREKNSMERTATIKKYLEEGPLVYDLYAILVHVGGAYGGHYYAFIKSFEDGLWYQFNDSNVTRMDPDEIALKAFGGEKSANAYKLLYRQIEKAEEVFETIPEEAIPEELRQVIEADRIAEEATENERIERMNKINVRVHYKKDVKLIPANLKETLEELFEKSLKEFNIFSYARQNIRLRAYQPTSETMQETYREKEKKTLEELKIGSQKNMILETKEDFEKFYDYDADRIIFKLSLWRSNLVSLEEKELQLKSVFVNRQATFDDLTNEVAKLLVIPPEKIRICKKYYWKGQPTAEILTKEENRNTTFIQLKLFENSTLYVEEIESEQSPCKWAAEFEKDAYRCKIRFNKLVKEINLENRVEYDGVVVVDSREKVQKLKEEIGKSLGISIDEFIIKKVGKMGVELKDLSRTIELENLVNGTSLFLELGKPAKAGEFRVQFFYASRLIPEIDALMHRFEHLCDLTIVGEQKASELKVLLAEKLREKLRIEADPRKMRLRERNNDGMSRIYRDEPMKDQYVTDKKQIAVEVLEYDDTVQQDDVLIVVRKWDSQTFELSPRIEIIVNRFINLKLFAKLIVSKYPEITVENLIGVKILFPSTMNRYALSYEMWSSLNEERNIVGNNPFYFSNDGFLLIVRDKSQPVNELTPQEQKELGVTIAKGTVLELKSMHGMYVPKESGGVKIKIKTKEEQEKEDEERRGKEGEDKKDITYIQQASSNQNREVVEEQDHLNPDDLCPLGD